VVTAPLYECKFSSFKSLIYKFKLLSNFLRIVSFLIDKGKITANKPHLKIMVIIFNINLHKYIKNKSNKMCLMTKRKSVEKRCNSVMHRFCHLEGGSTCATYLCEALLRSCICILTSVLQKMLRKKKKVNLLSSLCGKSLQNLSCFKTA
jgi:superfamily I DNA and RNA helicase